uniref:Small ribosomal subunit protein uS9c n=1 Tax=Capsosiphon fulvescens TaxID=205396 RepID=A0A3P8MUK6_9CHLO|nr:ribosomal protein S9 [Capsosiphon fulvescens]AWX64051.1 ribosomal protein S9 [Capsosiphon fulvescens]AYV89968.1 ribosomal protein S9 [Capsosiphon fulvescens]
MKRIVLNQIKSNGRRKSSVATVELVAGDGQFIINGKEGTVYMQNKADLIFAMQSPLDLFELKNNYNIVVKVMGGGLVGQANAIKLAVARALCFSNDTYRAALKSKGLLTRDARVKERKKYGLKKARKAPQFSKR